MTRRDKEIYESLKKNMWDLEHTVTPKPAGKPITIDPNVKPGTIDPSVKPPG